MGNIGEVIKSRLKDKMGKMVDTQIGNLHKMNNLDLSKQYFIKINIEIKS